MLEVANECECLATKSKVNIGKWRSICGKLLHCAHIIHDLRLFLNRFLLGLRGCPSFVFISRDQKLDFLWVAANLKKINNEKMMNDKAIHNVVINVSQEKNVLKFKLGNYIVLCDKVSLTLQQRIMFCIHDLVQKEKEVWANKTVIIENDCRGFGLLKYGKSRDLLALSVAREIWTILFEHNISFHIEN